MKWPPSFLLTSTVGSYAVLGPAVPPSGMVAAVAELSRRTAYPIFADPLSGLRFGPHTESAPVVGSYESFLQHPTDFEAPQVIIRFGALPTSKYLNDYLQHAAPPYQIHVRSSGVWADDSHRLRYLLQVDETAFCRRLADKSQRPLGQWAAAVLAAGQRSMRLQAEFLQDAWFDASAVATAVDALPPGANLFLGNSLPVRHVDQFAQPDRKQLHLYGNRGASGIDGIVSSALGVAAADQGRADALCSSAMSAFTMI